MSKELGRALESDIIIQPEKDREDIFSLLPSSQIAEAKRVYQTLVEEDEERRQEYIAQGIIKISPDDFERRVKDAVWLMNELLDLDVFQSEGREQFANNSKISLENFLLEEVVEYGTDAGELKEEINVEYEKVKQSHSVAINVNYRSLVGVFKHGEYKHYHGQVSTIRRDEVTRKGRRSSKYHEARMQRDRELDYDQNFIITCMATQNGQDEYVGPAPFYGHGVITLDPEKIEGRVNFFEGDSGSASKDIIEKIVPRWLFRKWFDIETRKLDELGACFSKSLMEVYLRRRNLTYMHLAYVEAHILGAVKLTDMKSIKYAVGLNEKEKQKLRLKVESSRQQGGASHKEIYQDWLEQLEQEERERNEWLERINQYAETNRLDKKIETVTFFGDIRTKEDSAWPNAIRSAVLRDHHF